LKSWKESTLRSASRPTLCGAIFDAPGKKAELAKTEQQISDPDFWNQPEKSQKIMQDRKRLEDSLAQETEVARLTSDLDTLFELGREGESVLPDIEREMKNFAARLETLETGMLLSGPNDPKSAIMAIHPGAGGTESQDWAEMLLRMYLRWAERNKLGVVITDRQEGDGAGIKSVTFEVNGENAYGMLMSEIGVHRLVRISPFDANARRHTSFASVFVYPEVDESIEVDINPADLRVDVYRASGAGGQHVNKTESAVRITHLPTGIVVQSQNDRSQHRNRAECMAMLKSRLYEFELRKRTAEQDKLAAQKTDIEWGHQIRSYVLDQSRIKDLRTGVEKGDTQRVLDGDLDDFIEASLKQGV